MGFEHMTPSHVITTKVKTIHYWFLGALSIVS